jgi:hypothetical protein
MADRNDVLLKEYELCEQQNQSMSHEIWTSTTIFMSASVILLTGLVYATITSDLLTDLFSRWNTKILAQLAPLGGIVIVGVGIILIFLYWIGWLKRMQFLTVTNYVRMRQIEKELGMRKNWLAFGYDIRNNPKLSNPSDPLPEGLAQELEALGREIPYAKPAGFSGLRKIAWIVIGIWGIFILFIAGILICRSLS